MDEEEKFTYCDHTKDWDYLMEHALQYSDDFLDLIKDHRHSTGLYFLYNRNKTLIYIGRSVLLGKRISRSVKERIKYAPRFVQWMETKSHTDACILEAYFVGISKPIANTDLCFEDEVSLHIENIPEKSKYIKIYED